MRRLGVETLEGENDVPFEPLTSADAVSRCGNPGRRASDVTVAAVVLRWLDRRTGAGDAARLQGKGVPDGVVARRSSHMSEMSGHDSHV